MLKIKKVLKEAKWEFIVNIIHRPELSPEYAEKSGGKKLKDVASESLDIFLFQSQKIKML